MRIVAYRARVEKGGVCIDRCIGDSVKTRLFSDFESMADALTIDIPDTLHVVWNLKHFAESIFSLLPEKLAEDITGNKNRVISGGTKIFYVDRWLGLTHRKKLRGNIHSEGETNFFGLTSWLSEPEPETVKGICDRGEAIIQALNSIGINPKKLTSPAGILTDQLQDAKLPTLHSIPDDNFEIFCDACDYSIKVMRHEWKSAFKIGHFDSLYCYDLTSAYPSLIAELPDTDDCEITYSHTYIDADFGIMKGTVTIDADISPIGYNAPDVIYPKGTWITYMTTYEKACIERYGIGTFKQADGYFFTFNTGRKPYQTIMTRLFEQRQTDNETLQAVIKRMSAGMSGKLDQDNDDGSYGELFNPVLALMVRSGCRVKVCEFIYEHMNLDSVVDINVDGILTTEPVNCELPIDRAMGNWRLEKTQKALILSKGEVWREDKKPLNLSYLEVTTALNDNPRDNVYDINGTHLYIQKPSTPDRIYSHYPKDGYEAMSRVSGSKPIEVKA